MWQFQINITLWMLNGGPGSRFCFALGFHWWLSGFTLASISSGHLSKRVGKSGWCHPRSTLYRVLDEPIWGLLILNIKIRIQTTDYNHFLHTPVTHSTYSLYFLPVLLTRWMNWNLNDINHIFYKQQMKWSDCYCMCYLCLRPVTFWGHFAPFQKVQLLDFF